MKNYMLIHEHKFGQTPYTFRSELSLEDLNATVSDVCRQLSVDWDQDDDAEGITVFDIDDGPIVILRTDMQKFEALPEEDKQDIYDSYNEAIDQSGDPNFMAFEEYLKTTVDFDLVGQGDPDRDRVL